MSDALATLRQAIAPKQGMRRIPLPMESYEHPSRPLTARRLLNMFAEPVPADSRSQAALLSVPGMEQLFVLPPGPVICMNDDLGEIIYVVSGDHLWRIVNTITVGPPVDLGEIGNTTANYAVTIAVGPTHVVVCVPPVAWYCTHTGTAVSVVAGGFPGATSVTYLDGYFVYSTYAGGTAQFFISGLLDPTTYDPLDFAYADAFPNAITRVMGLHGDIWIAGESGLEVWYDAGAADFPFRRRTGGMIAIPVAHPRSVALGDGSLWWVGRDDAVYRTVGYQAKRVSTHAIESRIHDAGGIGAGSGAFNVSNAYYYTENGHGFYVVSFFNSAGGLDPILDGLTLVYDASTDKWHDRASGTGGVGRWRGAAAGKYSDITILGDYSAGGVIWKSVPEVGTEGVQFPLRSFTLPPLWASSHRGFCHRLEIELEVGTAHPPGPITLEWSDDGGWTWTGSRVLQTAGAQGTRQRVYTTRLGSFRQRVFRVSATAGRLIVYGVDADISGGMGG